MVSKNYGVIGYEGGIWFFNQNLIREILCGFLDETMNGIGGETGGRRLRKYRLIHKIYS